MDQPEYTIAETFSKNQMGGNKLLIDECQDVIEKPDRSALS